MGWGCEVLAALEAVLEDPQMHLHPELTLGPLSQYTGEGNVAPVSKTDVWRNFAFRTCRESRHCSRAKVWPTGNRPEETAA
jgi:hypothetical protein